MVGMRAVALALLASTASAATYDVGPGMPYAAIGDVPIESLGAGDEVRVHWRAAPYKEKLVLGNGGTMSAPLVLRGVPEPGGALPILDGEGATTRSQLDYCNQPRSVLKIGGSSAPADAPQWVVVEGLDIRGGHPTHGFTDSDGAARAYADNAAAIHVENGAHVTIRGCILRDSANGLFVSSDTADVLVEGNYLHDNGVVGDIFVHNNYTEARGIMFQGNRFGPLAPGAGGNNLKDRSAGLVVRYNWVEGGNRQLDLVDSVAFASLPAYRQTFVYGNILVEPDGAGNRQIVHYGGDGPNAANYRKGTLYFYANTVVSTRGDRTTLFRLSTPEETADVRNNIFYATGAGGDTELLAQDGDLRWGWNWIKPGWTASFAGATGTVTDLGGRVEGATPGFVGAGDFRLAAGSTARDAAGPLAAGAPAVTLQYVVHQGQTARLTTVDLGAFGCATGCGPPPPDAGPTTADAPTGPGLVDAGAPADAPPGVPATGGEITGGCSTSGASGVSWAWALVLLCLWREAPPGAARHRRRGDGRVRVRRAARGAAAPRAGEEGRSAARRAGATGGRAD